MRLRKHEIHRRINGNLKIESAHQQISVLAYNLVRNFQIDSGIAKKRPATTKRTNIFEFESLKTIRFELINAAGRIVNVAGSKILRLNQNIARKDRYEKIIAEIDKLAA